MNSGYGLATRTDAPVDRPAAGGTCYTNIKMGQTISIIAYDITTLLGPTTWLATTSGAQAYAYPFDGFGSQNSTSATSTDAENLAHPAPTQSSSEGFPNTAPSPSSPRYDEYSGGLNKAAQIGTVVGCVIGGLGLIVSIIFGFKTVRSFVQRLTEETL